MARVRPNRANYIRFDSAASIRAEIARAIPLYAGIETLSAKGDQVQWGGPALYADGRFATDDGRAHFSTIPAAGLEPSEPPGARSPEPEAFRLSTRRGKQFNSMVQREVDPLTGARRDDVLVAEADAVRLGLARPRPCAPDIHVRNLRRPSQDFADPPWQPRGALARGQHPPVELGRGPRVHGAGLQHVGDVGSTSDLLISHS